MLCMLLPLPYVFLPQNFTFIAYETFQMSESRKSVANTNLKCALYC